jgi:hypothetical protein
VTTPETRQAERLARKCYPIFAGVDPAVQGAALVDLVSRHIAGHVVQGDEEATGQMRAMLLEAFVHAVKQLIPVADAEVIQPELKRRRH